MIPPAAPEFGAPCPITPSPQTVAMLAARRSASPFALAASQPWWHDADYIAAGRAACCTDPFCATPTGRRTFIAAEA